MLLYFYYYYYSLWKASMRKVNKVLILILISRKLLQCKTSSESQKPRPNFALIWILIDSVCALFATQNCFLSKTWFLFLWSLIYVVACSDKLHCHVILCLTEINIHVQVATKTISSMLKLQKFCHSLYNQNQVSMDGDFIVHSSSWNLWTH